MGHVPFVTDDETLVVAVDNDELFLVAVVESLLNLMHCVLRVSSVGLKSEMMRLTKVVALQVYWLQANHGRHEVIRRPVSAGHRGPGRLGEGVSSPPAGAGGGRGESVEDGGPDLGHTHNSPLSDGLSEKRAG